MQFLLKFSARFFIFLPVVILLGVVLFFSETLFLADDFHLLESVVRLYKPVSLQQKIQWLLQQHNEHRILVPRLITWLDYQLEGYINWRALMLLGNLIWCGVLYFLWSAFRSLRLSVWYFVPVPWLLFHPIYFDNLTWTISVLQQSVIVFLLSWLVYAFSNGRFLLAIGIFLLGTFTHGNGIFGFGVGLVFLALYREWRWLGVWLLVGALTALVYFYGFAKGQSANFDQSLADPLRAVAYFCAFLGSIMQSFGWYAWEAVAGGMVLVGGLGWFLVSRLYAHFQSGRSLGYLEKMLLGHVLFIGVTALLVAISRSWLVNNYQIPSRYAHYSPYLTAWFYLTILSVFPRSRVAYWAIFGMAGAIVIWVASYLNYFTKLEFRRDSLRADEANWHNYAVFQQYSPAFNHNIRPDYTAALASGICRTSSGLPRSFRETSQDSTLQLNFEKTHYPMPESDGERQETFLHIFSSTWQGPTPLLVLLPDKGQPVWIPFYRPRNGYHKMVKGLGLRKEEMNTGVFTHNLPVGHYRVGLYTDQKLTLTSYHMQVQPNHEVEVF